MIEDNSCIIVANTYSERAAMFSALVKARKELHVVDPFIELGDKGLRFLYQLHKSAKVNHWAELPKQDFWLSHNANLQKLSEQCERIKIIVIEETASCAHSKSALRLLRTFFPHANLSYQFLNPFKDCYSNRLITRVEKLYDNIITISPRDAAKYGWKLHEPFYYRIPPSRVDLFPQCDVFFVGNDKGRLKSLLDWYDQLTSLGLICSFHIAMVPPERREIRSGIRYLDESISYEEIINRLVQARCLLELVYENMDFATLRTMEALAYNKLLITTNKSLVGRDFYDPHRMIIVEKPSDFKSEDCVELPLSSKYAHHSSFDGYLAFLEGLAS